jgi:hypothetical protein
MAAMGNQGFIIVITVEGGGFVAEAWDKGGSRGRGNGKTLDDAIGALTSTLAIMARKLRSASEGLDEE